MSEKDLRIVFAGTPEFAAKHLQSLLDNEFNVVGVYTQPDRPAGRGKKLQASDVKKLALEYEIDVFQPQSLKSEQEQKVLEELQADIMVVVAYGLLLPKAILETPTYGCINVHGSILPKWRGAAPIQRSVLEGDKETGVTIMQMDVGLDTGDILHIEKCLIDKDETSGSLYNKLQSIGPYALIKTITDIASGKIIAQPQDNSLASYAQKLTKTEAEINWNDDAESIERKVRGYLPWPVAYTYLNNQPVKILKVSILDTDSGHPGYISKADKNGIVVCTSTTDISILSIQPPGKKALSTQDFLNGRADWCTPGSSIG